MFRKAFGIFTCSCRNLIRYSEAMHHYSLPLLGLCCIVDYRLPDISRIIRNNRLGKLDHGDNQMKEKDEDIAHPGIVSKPEKTPNFGPLQ